MSLLFNENAPKKTTSLTINTDLLVQAKELNINISSILESALIQTLKQRKRDNWIKENGSGPVSKSAGKVDPSTQLKALQDLLNAGLISQEDFDKQSKDL